MDEREKTTQTYGERLKKKVDKHMELGHGQAQAVALSMQECQAEDEAAEKEVKARGAQIGNVINPPDPCIADKVTAYEAAGMNPMLAAQRAEEDCLAEHGMDTASPIDTPKQVLDKEVGQTQNAYKRDIPQSARDKLPETDFAGPYQSFPIAKPEDVAAAADLVGKADNPDAVKAKIIAIAKRKGAAYVAQLPESWTAKKSWRARIDTRLKELGVIPKTDDEATSFKVVGNHWLATWTNNFKDRDEEIFPERAIEAYIARVDTGIVPKPELHIWHGGKQLRVGMAEEVAGHGHFGIAAGVFDDTPQGAAARDYYADARHAKDTSISHGFTFPVGEFDGTHYKHFNTFEISLLPRGVEANLYTSLEGVKAMQLSERKIPYFEQVFGKEVFAQIRAHLDEKGKALEELGAEYKDFSGGEDLSTKEAIETANKSFIDLVPDLVEGSAEAVTSAVEAVKAAKEARKEATEANAKYADAMKEIDALRKAMQLRPRMASRDAETIVDKDAATKAFPDLQTTETYFDEGLGVLLKRDPLAANGNHKVGGR